ncbi:zona pellucida sperm-binding protein 4-like [Paroedura picta]|uniref:zona pellucida sperm-binding protein 4-like n=1 Tax=Paroedura picta TaxID=143630 RepID=UPI00405612E2
MGVIQWLLGPFVRLGLWMFLCSFVLSDSSFENRKRLWSHSQIYCRKESLQLTLPANHSELIRFVTLLDPEGRSYPLNNAVCGISTSWNQDNFMVVTVPFANCFFIKKNENFVMTVRIEGKDAAGADLLYDKELKCPTGLPDAPSSSECAEVKEPDRLPCATQLVTQEECEEKGCCYAPGDTRVSCYYGNTVTAQCTPDGHFSIAVSRDVTLPSLILDSVHLVGRGSGCFPVAKNNVFVLYKFPLSACGTTFQGAEDQGIYANELMAHRDVRNWNTGSVKHDSIFRLYISCSYSTGNFLPLTVNVFTLPPPPPVTQYGPLNLELRIASDKHYSEYYTNRDYPVIKLLRDPVFLEVRILQRTDSNLVLVLHDCWATPSTNPLQQHQWPILLNRCPYGGDNYQTHFILVEEASGLQFPSHYQRFVVSTFTFVDSTSQPTLTGPVYFHCSASACIPSVVESCMAHCPGIRAKRRMETHDFQGTLRSLVTAEGPVDFKFSNALEANDQKGSHWYKTIFSEEWERALVVAVGMVLVALLFVGLRKYWRRPKCEEANIL